MIDTERLRLREMHAGDAAFVLELMNEPAYHRNIGDRGLRTVADAEHAIVERYAPMYVRLGFGMYVVERRADGEPLGICGLVKRDSLVDVDIGYALLQRHWGCGFAFEAAEAMLRHAREVLRLPRIVAITAPGNEPSMKLLRKLGLRYERTLQLPEGESAFFST